MDIVGIRVQTGYFHMFKIREANEQDTTFILQILHQLSDCSKSNPEDVYKILSKHFLDNSSYYHAVVTDKDKIIAFGTLLKEQKISHNCGIAAHIEDIVVDKDYRCQGIGKMLVAHLVELAKLSKAYKIILDCDPEKINFYEKCGFYLNGVAMRMDLE